MFVCINAMINNISKKDVNVICLPTEHQGVHKNSFRNARAFQDRIGIWKCWILKMLDFEERGKPEYPEKNLPKQSREPTNSTHI